jgi:uncharacterized membrane protein
MRKSKRLNHKGAYIGLSLATIAAASAGAAYFLDPRSGRRRRALLRDQASRLAHQSCDFVAKAGRDARQRIRGLYEESANHFRGIDADDTILEQRVRAELGRLSTHPGAIEVSSNDAVVRLRGDALETEVPQVLAGVKGVRGVKDVVNEMRVHQDAGSIPSLQGEGDRRPARFEYFQENWAPAPRLLAGAAGLAFMVDGFRRHSPVGLGLATIGAALLGRSVSNAPWSRLLGIGASAEDGVLVQKTIHVYADLDEAYEAWRDPEGFPQFMRHVREVRRVSGTRYHWTVDGPAGIPVEWDAVITADVPGELIAWRTVEDSPVQSAGFVQFEPSEYGGTRVHVRMSYRPPANVVGHTVAKIFGRDPKRQIDSDLARFKTFIETGQRPRDSAVARQAQH